MNQGEIVARGAHDELMATSELYRRLAAQLNTTGPPEDGHQG